jgi:hypothetical protein
MPPFIAKLSEQQVDQWLQRCNWSFHFQDSAVSEDAKTWNAVEKFKVLPACAPKLSTPTRSRHNPY